MIKYSPLDYTDSLTIALLWVAILSGVALILGWIADRPWHGRDVSDDLPLIPPARSLARRTGEGAARQAGPGGAPDTVPITMPDARRYATPTEPIDVAAITAALADHDTQQLPPLVVDSPPGALGTEPTDLPGIQIIRRPRWGCGLCHDGADVIGAECVLCGAKPTRTEARP